MLCTRKTKTLVSTCVILSGMTNIVCLLYVGWITNYVANGGPKVAESGGGEADRKLEEDSKGESLRIMERLDRLESVVNEHIKGRQSLVDHLRALKRFVSSSISLSAGQMVACWGSRGQEALSFDLREFV
ncbi:Polypeptide N-acetylgalactosaminyltransferase 18 [Takifugu flavidus]|uniref:Polypeptide N-acetylgalactosaminyltransferase 18 n=1 Tax=Takifugu flavidus TaxID=433684 RepID=A0A5C6PAS9_9TELE|nr:Polypeptide N-acetylgalactosaminyltransferase 18 [Takifugu flavidus]